MRRILIVVLAATFSSVAEAQIAVSLSEFKLELARDTVPAGSMVFRINNTGGIAHAVYVRGPGVDQGTREIPARQTASLTVALKPGTYEVFCPLADGSHKAAGMTKQLVVTPAPSSPSKKP